METNDLNLNDEFKIIGPTTGVYEDTILEIRVDIQNVNRTVKGEMCSVPVKELVRRGDKVYKVVDS
jgi:putative protease